MILIINLDYSYTLIDLDMIKYREFFYLKKYE
jgi:hypothetical protein